MNNLCPTSVLLITYFFFSVTLYLLKHIISLFWACQVIKGIRHELPVITMKIISLHARCTKRIDRYLVPLVCGPHDLLTLLFLFCYVLMTLLYLLYHLIYYRLCILSFFVDVCLSFLFLFLLCWLLRLPILTHYSFLSLSWW